MYRVPVRPRLCWLVGLQERDIVGRGGVCTEAFYANAHRSYIDIQLFYLREEVEQVMRRQGQVCCLDAVRPEVQAGKGQGRSQRIRGDSGGSRRLRRETGDTGGRSGQTRGRRPPVHRQLQTVCQCLLMLADELSERPYEMLSVFALETFHLLEVKKDWD